ncbi:MAG: hypothetical protein E6R00_07235 [Gammaproteobacteria bacterium]|nr:MAG: hypothetical protein E6R00_07235 [Gammaproteobacteria bacterium]
MGEIVASVKRVSDLIAKIATASADQSAGIGQVNTAVAQMDQVVQQNASLVEEATAATESMKDQAAALLQTVAQFRLDAAAAPQRVEPLARAATSEPAAPIPFKSGAPASLPSSGPLPLRAANGSLRGF